MVQWVDAIGKWGPVIVALLVLFTTRAQNRWQNAIVIRAAQVEDQKFRLNLLDRRNAAIEKVNFAISQFWTEGAVRQDAVEATGEALRIAELVFDDAERAAIEGFLGQIWSWQSLNRQLKALRDRRQPDSEARYQAIADRMHDAEGELMNSCQPLLVLLREAARVRSVPSIKPYQGPIRAMIAWARR